MECNAEADRNPLDQAVDALRTAMSHGTPIVPLFGAGISVSAGVPLTHQIVHHLAQFTYYHRNYHRPSWPSFKDYLLANGWPSIHQLSFDLLSLLDREGKSSFRQEIAREITEIGYRAVREEIPFRPMLTALLEKLGGYSVLAPDASKPRAAFNSLLDRPDYRSLLNYITGRDQNLIDAFFDRLVRSRPPATSHQFISFLAKLMNWRLILTTNFDDLIEEALRHEGMQPLVYELTRDQSPPDARLVRNHLSVVKLHGGAFNLRAGFDLDEDLGVGVLATLREYLPRNAIVVVLGYSGGDRRVMSLLEALGPDWRGSGDVPKIIWVYREHLQERSEDGNTEATAGGLGKQVPPAVANLESRILRSSQGRVHRSALQRHNAHRPVIAIPYRDGALFLQELYERLTVTHAASRARYHSIPHLPRNPDPRVEIDSKDDAVCFLHAAESGHGTSRGLARYVRHFEDEGYHSICIDLAQIGSVATLATMLLNEFGRYDRHLPPVTMPPLLESVLTTIDVVNPEKIDELVARLVYCMRRDRYVVALDSAGEFYRHHPADKSLFPDGGFRAMTTSRVRLLHEFLLKWVGVSREFGQSKLCIAATCPDPSDDVGGMFNSFFDQVGLSASPYCHDMSERPKLETCGDAVKFVAQPSLEGVVLTVCSAFRRSRSFVGIVKVASRILHGDKGLHSSWVTPGIQKEFERLVKKRSPLSRGEAEHRVIEELLVECNRRRDETEPPLTRQEGGFYWMHHKFRNGIYRTIASRDARLFELHDAIADYYHDELYEKSRDVTAYMEYVYHRSVSAAMGGADSLVRLEWLVRSLSREKDDLLRYGRATTVLNHLLRLLAVVKNLDKRERPRKWKAFGQLRNRLLDIKSAILRNCTVYDECIKTRTQQLEALLSEDWFRPSDADPGDTFKRSLDDARERLESRDPARIEKATELIARLIEIPTCQGGNHVIRSDKKLERARKDLRDILEMMDGHFLPERVQSGSTSLATGQPAPVDAAGGDDLLHLHLRCMYRLMDNILRGVDPWGENRSAQVLTDLHEAEELGGRARLLTRRTQSPRGRRFKCYILCLMARAALLSEAPQRPRRGGPAPMNFERFKEAEDLLDLAHAVLPRAGGVKESTARGVTCIHQAECVIRHAFLLRVAELEGARRTLLDRGEIYINQAREHLVQGKRDNYWWPRLYILEARLQVERLERSAHVAAYQSHQPNANDHYAQEYALIRKDPIDLYVRDGLAAICSARESITDDDTQRSELIQGLWELLCKCWFKLGIEDGREKVLADWWELNERAGLGHRRPESFAARNLDVAARIWTEVQEQAAKAMAAASPQPARSKARPRPDRALPKAAPRKMRPGSDARGFPSEPRSAARPPGPSPDLIPKHEHVGVKKKTDVRKTRVPPSPAVKKKPLRSKPNMGSKIAPKATPGKGASKNKNASNKTKAEKSRSRKRKKAE